VSTDPRVVDATLICADPEEGEDADPAEGDDEELPPQAASGRRAAVSAVVWTNRVLFMVSPFPSGYPGDYVHAGADRSRRPLDGSNRDHFET
jgi:hypothetical protein